MYIESSQLDALQWLVNGGVEQAVVALNEILDFQIGLQVPQVEILSVQQANQKLEQQIGLTRVSAMRLSFTGTLGGNALLVFPIHSAAQLIAVLMHEQADLPDLDAIKRGMLSEVSNIVLNGVMTEISQVLKQSLRYAMPFYFEGTVAELLVETVPPKLVHLQTDLPQTDFSSIAPPQIILPETAASATALSAPKPQGRATILLAQTRLTCDQLQFTGDIVLVFTVRAFDTLLMTLDRVRE
jgi:chemotaxis protein CheC